MSESKHTPEWHWQDTPGGFKKMLGPKDGPPVLVVAATSRVTSENRNLIAAAPDLLEAAKAMFENRAWETRSDEAWGMLEEAINKAECRP